MGLNIISMIVHFQMVVKKFFSKPFLSMIWSRDLSLPSPSLVCREAPHWPCCAVPRPGCMVLSERSPSSPQRESRVCNMKMVWALKQP